MKTILLADSDAPRRQMHARLLSRRGYRVLHADTAASVRAVAGHRHIDIHVVDSDLADDTGVGLLRSAQSIFDGSKVVYLSTFVHRESSLYRELSDELDISLLLHKPINPSEFGRQIDQLIAAPNASRLEQELIPWTPSPAGGRRPVADPPVDRRRAPTPTATVLVVDDDQAFVDKARGLGDQLLIDVRQAVDAADALGVLEDSRQHIDAIFVAIECAAGGSSASQDTRALLDSIRTCPDMPPLGLLSASGDIDERVQGVRCGAVVFLAKPVDSTHFTRAVHQLVSLQRAEPAEVLIVDSDANFVSRTRQLFDRQRIGLTHLADPTDLLGQLERVNPDAVLLEATLDEVGGFDLCRVLRTTPRWQDLPVVFLSNDDAFQTKMSAFASGGDDFLVKHAAAQELLARVKVRIERSRLMKQRADRDLLTGLLTRRAFLEAVAARLSEARRNADSLSFCMLDLDHFKQINDTHGHSAGDRVLAGLGRLLKDRFRLGDLRGRWGGEEFAVAIVNEQAATVEKILGRIQREFEAVDFEGTDGGRFHVTFSAGIAQFPGDGSDVDPLLQTADRRLYAAKNAGRDQVRWR